MKKQKKSAAQAALGNIPHEDEAAAPAPNAAVAYGAQNPSPTARRLVAKDDKNAWVRIIDAALLQIEDKLDEARGDLEAAYLQAIEEGDEENDKKKKWRDKVSSMPTA